MKMRLLEESKRGDLRVYNDPKLDLTLQVNKYETRKGITVQKDSIQKWAKPAADKLNLKTDSLETKDILVNVISYKTEIKDSRKSKFIYTFPTKSHLYKLDFSFPCIKKDKCLKEIDKIMESLFIDCN